MNTIEDTNGVPGKFSLRDAIHASNNVGGPNVINFDLAAIHYLPPGHLPIGLKSALEPIAQSLTINGADAIDVVRVPPPQFGTDDDPPPPPPKYRIFQINGGVTADFEDLGMYGGDVTGDGGAILNNGSLELNGCTVGSSRANGSGGGVMNNGVLTLDRTTVNNNTAGADGGGIKSTGDLTLRTSTVKDNTAAGNGGGVYYGGSNRLTINLAFVQNNTSTGGDGGGMYIIGGDLADVWDTETTGNKATGNGNNGGGIYVDSAHLFYSGGLISANSAKGNGGGLYAGNNAQLEVERVTISGNSTDANGGGVALEPSVAQTFRFTHCTLYQNECTDWINGKGGAVFVSGPVGSTGTLVLTDCNVSENSAAFGGGLYTERLTHIEAGRFLFNSATWAGGAIYGGKANMDINVYEDDSGIHVTELSYNEAPANMGAGIAWELNGGGILSYVIQGTNSEDVDYI